MTVLVPPSDLSHSRSTPLQVCLDPVAAIRDKDIFSDPVPRAPTQLRQAAPPVNHFARKVEIRHLRYFESVVRNGSFRAAAQELNISQPPLSRQIRQIEEILGTTLLLRNSSGVETTAAGKSFYAEANNILKLVENACSNTSLVGSGKMGRIDIGVFGSAVLEIIPKIVLCYKQNHPDVDVVIHNMDRDSQLKALEERRIMVGFNRYTERYTDFTTETVTKERLVLIAPSGHSLAREGQVTLADLAGEPLILYPRSNQQGGFTKYLANLFRNANVEPEVVHYVDDVVTAVSLVSSGLGVAIGVDSSRNLKLPGICHLKISDLADEGFDLNLIYRSSEVSNILRSFLTTIRSIYPLQSADKRTGHR